MRSAVFRAINANVVSKSQARLNVCAISRKTVKIWERVVVRGEVTRV